MSFHNYTKKRNRLETNLCSRKSIQAPGLWSCGCGGKRGVGENPHPARVPVLWAGGRGRTATRFARGPRWASGCVKPLTPHSGWWTRGSPRSLGLTEARDNRFSVSDIPNFAVCHRRAENKVWACRWLWPEAKGKKAGGESSSWFLLGGEVAWLKMQRPPA